MRAQGHACSEAGGSRAEQGEHEASRILLYYSYLLAVGIHCPGIRDPGSGIRVRGSGIQGFEDSRIIDFDPDEDQTAEGEQRRKQRSSLSPFLLFVCWTMMQRDSEGR